MSDDIGQLLYPLVDETKKSLSTLKKEFQEILKYDPKVKNADENIKLKLARSILRRRYKKTNDKKLPEKPVEHKKDIINVKLNEEHFKKLKSPNLLLDIIDEVQNQGIIGNEPVILNTIVVSSLRFVKNKEPISSNLLLSSLTGTGKDKTIKATLDTLGKERITYFHRNGLSEKIFSYWDKPSDDIESWDDVILYLEDPQEDLLNGQTFKVVASGGSESSVVKEQGVLHTKLNGKPTFIVTSMGTTIKIEGSRRWLDIPTDSCEELNIRVQNEKIEKHNKPYVLDKILNEALCFGLKRYNVIIPKIRVLKDLLEPTTLNNTFIDVLLDYIKAITVLFQYQRETDKNGNLITTDDDILLGSFIFMLAHKQGGTSSYIEENIYSILLANVEPMYKRDIRTSYSKMFNTGITDYKLRQTLNIMVEKGRLTVTQKHDDTSNRYLDVYAIKEIGHKNSEKLLFTEEQESNQNSDILLMTNLQIGHKRNTINKEIYDTGNTVINTTENKLNVNDFNFYLSLMNRRLKNKLHITLLHNSLNLLMTKLLNIFLVVKTVKKEFLNLMTKNAELVKESEKKPVSFCKAKNYDELSLYEKVQNLKRFCLSGDSSLKELYSTFDKEFIDNCVERGVLVKVTDNTYNFVKGGVKITDVDGSTKIIGEKDAVQYEAI